MNIFYLDRDPKTCAEMHCDKHVVKMIIEYAQLMSTAHRLLDGTQDIEKRYVHGSLPARWRHIKVWKHPSEYMDKGLMRASHVSHPSNIWVRASKENYMWLCQMWLWLMKEYTHRYGKHHACEARVEYLMDAPKNIPTAPFTDPTPAMPEHCKVKNNSLSSYHNYYIQEKVRFAKWTARQMPTWYKQGVTNADIRLPA
jgi:hypothetical protein